MPRIQCRTMYRRQVWLILPERLESRGLFNLSNAETRTEGRQSQVSRLYIVLASASQADTRIRGIRAIRLNP